MDAFWEIITSWYFMGGAILVLIILIGVFFFLRSRRPED
jgi:hypothetical protein